MARAMNHLIEGTWRLLRHERLDTAGKVNYRGTGDTGILIYSSDGHMSVTIMGSGRKKWASEDPLAGTAAERASAAKNYISYSGRYKLAGDEVVHEVEISLFPNMIGAQLHRQIQIAGNKLTLTTPLFLIGGRQCTARLVWQRVKSLAKKK